MISMSILIDFMLLIRGADLISANIYIHLIYKLLIYNMKDFDLCGLEAGGQLRLK